MKIIYFCTICCILFQSFAYADPEIRGNPAELESYLLDEQKVILIGGTGEVKIQADKAVVSLRIKTVEEKFAKAIQQNRSVRENIWKKIIAGGVPADKVQFSKFSSTPNYGWFGDKPSSYAVFNEVKVTIADEEQLLIIATIVDDIKEVQFGTTELVNTESKASINKAIEESLKEIANKKKLYEAELGVTLVPIKVVENNSVEQARVTGIQRQKSARSSYSGAQEIGIEKVQTFGEQTYKSTVAVKYIIKGL